MKLMKMSFLCVVTIAIMGIGTPAAMAQETLKAGGQEVEVPQLTQPGLFTLKGEFTRIAYNNEG